MTQIGANAFKNCKALTKLTLPAKVAKIDANAFSGCKKLKTLTIKNKKLKAKKKYYAKVRATKSKSILACFCYIMRIYYVYTRRWSCASTSKSVGK